MFVDVCEGYVVPSFYVWHFSSSIKWSLWFWRPNIISQCDDAAKKSLNSSFLCCTVAQLIEAGSRWQCLFGQRIVEKCYCPSNCFRFLTAQFFGRILNLNNNVWAPQTHTTCIPSQSSYWAINHSVDKPAIYPSWSRFAPVSRGQLHIWSWRRLVRSLPSVKLLFYYYYSHGCPFQSLSFRNDSESVNSKYIHLTAHLNMTTTNGGRHSFHRQAAMKAILLIREWIFQTQLVCLDEKKIQTSINAFKDTQINRQTGGYRRVLLPFWHLRILI